MRILQVQYNGPQVQLQVGVEDGDESFIDLLNLCTKNRLPIRLMGITAFIPTRWDFNFRHIDVSTYGIPTNEYLVTKTIDIYGVNYLDP